MTNFEVVDEVMTRKIQSLGTFLRLEKSNNLRVYVILCINKASQCYK